MPIKLLKEKSLTELDEIENLRSTLCENVQIQRLFWSLFSRIRTKYSEIRTFSRSGSCNEDKPEEDLDNALM